MSSKAVIIPAAGSGSRLGSDIPKAFIQVSGKPIIQRSIECFLGVEGMRQIIIPVPEKYIGVCEEICSVLESDEVNFNVVVGGDERQLSIWNGIKNLQEDIELVAIHDAARPFVKTDHIMQCFNGFEENDGVVLGIPSKDTIKRTGKNDCIVETPNRDFLWQAQTPQVFRKGVILRAYESAITDGFLGTDDASLVERIGGFVKMIEGDTENIKITHPIDLKIAELIAEDRL